MQQKILVTWKKKKEVSINNFWGKKKIEMANYRSLQHAATKVPFGNTPSNETSEITIHYFKNVFIEGLQPCQRHMVTTGLFHKFKSHTR